MIKGIKRESSEEKIIHDIFHTGKHGNDKFSRFIAVHYHNKESFKL